MFIHSSGNGTWPADRLISSLPPAIKKLIPEEYHNQPIGYEIKAGSVHTFIIRSYQPPEENDVVVDWDHVIGYYDHWKREITKLKDITPVWDEDEQEYQYTVSHYYPSGNAYALRKIKIYGKNYFAIKQSENLDENILCNVFGPTNKLASHITNLSSFAKYARYLFYVDFSNTLSTSKLYNFANLFLESRNLRGVVNYPYLERVWSCSKMFSSCRRLQTTDFIFPRSTVNADGFKDLFYFCIKLEADVANLLPEQGFLPSDGLSFRNVFYNCQSLSKTQPPADKLWAAQDIVWTDITGAFYGSPIQNYIPESWGGSKEDNLCIPIKENPNYYMELSNSSTQDNDLIVTPGYTVKLLNPLTLLTINGIEEDVNQEYVVIFTTGSEVHNISVPERYTILGTTDFKPETQYIICIKNGFTIIAEVEQ